MEADNKAIIDAKAEENIVTKRIVLYLAVTFVLTYAVEIGVIVPLVKQVSVGMQQTGQFLVGMMMFMPAIGVVITRLITKEGLKEAWLKPVELKKNIRYYLLAWFLPAFLSVVGAVIYFVCNPQEFDPSMSYMAQVFAASGQEMPKEQLKLVVIVQCLTAVLLGPVLNCLTCFGEEWGWRGYLLPKMLKKLPIVPTLLINGVIWGLWHAPITCIGHNYGVGYPGFPFAGIAMMCVFCTIIGVFFSYVTLKSKSCIPAVIGHGALNSFAAASLYVTKNGGNPFLGPGPTGIIGMSGFIVTAVICVVLLCRKKK